MIIWCSYCQSYYGEKEPVHDYSLTHGICEACQKKSNHQYIQGDNFKKVQGFFHDLLSRVHGGEQIYVDEILDKSQVLGINPLDLFFGIVQPILCKLGDETQQGKSTIIQEHLFTDFAEQLIQKISNMQNIHKQSLLDLDLLLISAPGSFHTLGVKSLEMELVHRGYKCRSITPGFPLEDLKNLVSKIKTHLLGISIATQEQMPEVIDFSLWAQKEISSLQVILGGPYIKQLKNLSSLPHFVKAFTRLDQLYLFIDSQLKSKS